MLFVKKYFFAIALFSFCVSLNAQGLKKYDIGSSGCKVYMFCDPGNFEMSYSEDSSKVYTGECKANDSLTYGVICAAFKAETGPGINVEDVLVAYLDYLKSVFNISSSVGYGKGHSMKNYPAAKGMIDYWTDKDGDEWKIKGWTDGKFIAVLYVYAKGKLDEIPRLNVFLDSFRFKGMQ
jgi:hypothetical protein